MRKEGKKTNRAGRARGGARVISLELGIIVSNSAHIIRPLSEPGDSHM